MRTLYCIAVISIAIVLALLGNWAAWAMSIVLLSGALPFLHLLWDDAATDGARAALLRLRQRVTTDEDDPLQEENQSLQEDADEEDPDLPSTL